ncbi:MAG: hypothetical protein MJY87_01680 [Fibrobacter sp.]|nr:hypothetical protein [Fibrobacter sp.]
MALKNFPIGVHDFTQIRENGYHYVDKSWTLRLHQIIRKVRDKENADVVVLE